MSSETWFANLDGILFTHFVEQMKKYIRDANISIPVSNIKMTTIDSEISPTKFPTIQFSEIESSEMGNTLDNTSINGVSEVIQITVYSNKQMQDVTKLMKYSVLAMKQLRFSTTGLPVYRTSHDVKFGVARFRRTIGANDTI